MFVFIRNVSVLSFDANISTLYLIWAMTRLKSPCNARYQNKSCFLSHSRWSARRSNSLIDSFTSFKSQSRFFDVLVIATSLLTDSISAIDFGLLRKRSDFERSPTILPFLFVARFSIYSIILEFCNERVETNLSWNRSHQDLRTSRFPSNKLREVQDFRNVETARWTIYMWSRHYYHRSNLSSVTYFCD